MNAELRRVHVVCRAPPGREAEALALRRRLVAAAATHLPDALARELGPGLNERVVVERLAVRLDFEPGSYDDVTLAALWAGRIRRALERELGRRLRAPGTEDVPVEHAPERWLRGGSEPDRPSAPPESASPRGPLPWDSLEALGALAGDRGRLRSVLALLATRPELLQTLLGGLSAREQGGLARALRAVSRGEPWDPGAHARTAAGRGDEAPRSDLRSPGPAPAVWRGPGEGPDPGPSPSSWPTPREWRALLEAATASLGAPADEAHPTPSSPQGIAAPTGKAGQRAASVGDAGSGPSPADGPRPRAGRPPDPAERSHSPARPGRPSGAGGDEERRRDPELPLVEGTAWWTRTGGLVFLYPWLPPYLARSPGIRLADGGDPEVKMRILALSALISEDAGSLAADPLVRVLAGSEPVDGLPPRPRAEVTDSEALDRAAREVLRSFARVLPGRSDVSDRWIRDGFLRRGGRVSRDEDGWEVRLDRGPLDVLLPYLPYPLGSFRLGWTDTIRVRTGGSHVA